MRFLGCNISVSISRWASCTSIHLGVLECFGHRVWRTRHSPSNVGKRTSNHHSDHNCRNPEASGIHATHVNPQQRKVAPCKTNPRVSETGESHSIVLER